MRLADGRVAPSATDPAVGAEIEAAIVEFANASMQPIPCNDEDVRWNAARDRLLALIARRVAEAEARAVGDGKSLDRERLGSALSLALLTFGPTPIPYLLEDRAVAVAERCRVAIAQMENGAELRHKLEQNYNAIDRDNEALRKERNEARAEIERLQSASRELAIRELEELRTLAESVSLSWPSAMPWIVARIDERLAKLREVKP